MNVFLALLRCNPLWLAYGYVCSWFLLKFYWLSDGGFGFDEVFWMLVLEAASVVLFFLLALQKVQHALGQQPFLANPRGRHSSALLLILVATFAMGFYNYPFRARLLLSLPAMHEFMERYDSYPYGSLRGRPPRGDVHVGLFHIRCVKRGLGGDWEWTTSECGFYFMVGVAYRPDWNPADSHGADHEHLLGDWWWFREADED